MLLNTSNSKFYIFEYAHEINSKKFTFAVHANTNRKAALSISISLANLRSHLNNFVINVALIILNYHKLL